MPRCVGREPVSRRPTGLGFPPGRVAKQRGEGMEYGYNRVGQGEHCLAFFQEGPASLPCSYNLSSFCAKSRQQVGAVPLQDVDVPPHDWIGHLDLVLSRSQFRQVAASCAAGVPPAIEPERQHDCDHDGQSNEIWHLTYSRCVRPTQTEINAQHQLQLRKVTPCASRPECNALDAGNRACWSAPLSGVGDSAERRFHAQHRRHVHADGCVPVCVRGGAGIPAGRKIHPLRKRAPDGHG